MRREEAGVFFCRTISKTTLSSSGDVFLTGNLKDALCHVAK